MSFSSLSVVASLFGLIAVKNTSGDRSVFFGGVDSLHKYAMGKSFSCYAPTLRMHKSAYSHFLKTITQEIIDSSFGRFMKEHAKIHSYNISLTEVGNYTTCDLLFMSRGKLSGFELNDIMDELNDILNIVASDIVSYPVNTYPNMETIPNNHEIFNFDTGVRFAPNVGGLYLNEKKTIISSYRGLKMYVLGFDTSSSLKRVTLRTS